MTLRLLAAAVTCGLLGLAGCSGSGSDASSVVDIPIASTLTTADVPDVAEVPEVDLTQDGLLGLWGVDAGTDLAERPRVPWVRFDHDGTFGGSDGCNQVGGRWTFDESAAVVTVDVRQTTLIACPGRDAVRLEKLTFDGEGLVYRREDGKTGTMAASTGPEVPMFVIESSTDRLASVPAPLYPSTPVRTPQERALAAVEALLAAKESGDRFSSLWGEVCGLGTGVDSIEQADAAAPVIVRLSGEGGALCDLTRRGGELRRQQLAWTVVTNLGVPESTAVRLLGPSGVALDADTTPDPAYLAR